MKIVIDIETNALENPDIIWCVVCKDIEEDKYYNFNQYQKKEFLEFASKVTLWIGHNWLEYDYPILNKLWGLEIEEVWKNSIDTLVISKLFDYPRKGHSIEDYGLEFNFPKLVHNDFSTYTNELLVYCTRDVDITHKVYNRYYRYICNNSYTSSIHMEQRFTYVIVNSLHKNGFYFNTNKAKELLMEVEKELEIIDTQILISYPKKLKLIREVTPRGTKYGTISKSSIPKKLREYYNDDLSCFSIDSPFSYCSWEDFNPSSHKQLIEVLHQAKWSPIDKTQTHINTERELNRLKYQKNKSNEVDLQLKQLYTDLERLGKYGWKINEQNLDTLPIEAPAPARLLAKRILLEARRRTLTEWLGLVQDDHRIHGKFYGIGAWTHRMAHQKPNTANIPGEFKLDGSIKYLGKEMRQLWRAPRNRLLVGVDAEGIQLRIFAHYINDPEFTDALVKGRKDDKTDPHSLNQRILGSVCKSRAAAKRFIYALLLGAGLDKLSQILECSREDTEQALSSLLQRYEGFQYLKTNTIPKDAKKGYFIGLDGRYVRIPGDTEGQRKHLAMSGYLQNGEAVIMKKSCLMWHDMLHEDKELFKLVNFVHDEWQTEVPNNMDIAIKIAKTQADSLRITGEELNLKCPLAGSYWNDDHHDYTIGTNWFETH